MTDLLEAEQRAECSAGHVFSVNPKWRRGVGYNRGVKGVVLVFLALVACWLPHASAAAQRRAAPPPALLHAERIDAAARTLPRLHSLLVSRRGVVIF
jgi:hypothetical protein